MTVLANMAASPSCRPDLRAVDGVAFLISMLESRAGGVGDDDNNRQAECAAAERVQKKAAIALSRLCTDAQVCFGRASDGRRRQAGRAVQEPRREELQRRRPRRLPRRPQEAEEQPGQRRGVAGVRPVGRVRPGQAQAGRLLPRVQRKAGELRVKTSGD